MIEIGSLINERYKIIGNIGSGGMANVFLAHDLILDRDVAVKVLRFDFQDDQAAIRRFQREALASSELVHPNIVSVYDVGEENGMQYLVMEYVKGTDLKKFIKHHVPIPHEQVVTIMRQILSAISLAHQHRIIHRDLKPQNILMDEYGNVKIADFGIAIALSETSLTQTNTLLGSVHYLSPEQARGSMATKQSDIYALGIILYELLTGGVPFEGESAVSIALKHFQNEIPSVTQVDPSIPQALENVVLKATAKEPMDRYRSAEEMSEDISTALSPARYGEPLFTPQTMLAETKILEPISNSDVGEMDEYLSQQTEEPLTKSADRPKEDQPTPSEEPETPPKKSPWKKVLVGALLGALAIVLFLIFAPKRVVVPDVSGLTTEAAIEELQSKKLIVKDDVKEVPSDRIEKGKVVKTDPEANHRTKEKAEVTLYVSTGSNKIVMKDYTEYKYTDAVNQLLSQGFKRRNITKREKNSEDIPEGAVISQSIHAGEEIDPESATVELVVSKGVKTVKLRNLMNYRKPDVQSYFEKHGLILVESYEFSDNVAEGLVLAQSPGPDVEVEAGSQITVTFSKGPKPVQPEPPTEEPDKPEETKEPEESSTDKESTDTSTSETTPPKPEESSKPEENTPALENNSNP